MRNLFWLLGGLIVVLSCASPSIRQVNRSPALQDFGGYGDPSSWSSPIEDLGDPTLENLLVILKTNPAGIDAFIHLIGEKFPKYLRYHTLAFRSKSLHASSYLSPRAIIFGSSGKSVITFNGDPNQNGYSKIEMVDFTKEKGYTFREIQFVNDARVGHDELMDEGDLDEKLSSTDIRISKGNPFKCMGCHSQGDSALATFRRGRQKLALPIWEPYFVWPGIYGSDDDNVYRGGPSLAKAFKLVATDIEETQYGAFQVRKSKREAGNRYFNLPEPQGISTFEERSNPLSDFHRPNGSLTKIFLYQTALLAIRDVSKKPNGLQKVAQVGRLICTHFAALRDENFQHEIEDLQPLADKFSQILLVELANDYQMKVPSQPSFQLNVSRTALNVLALRSVGIDWKQYAFNSIRAPIFEDGAYNLQLGQAAGQVLADLISLGRPATCGDFEKYAGSKP